MMEQNVQAVSNLKVLLVSPSPPPVGGIQSWTVNILDFLKSNDEIQYCYIDSAVKYKDILEIGLWKRITAGIRVTADLIKALKKTLPKENPNIIHLTSSASLALLKDYLILKLAKKFNVPLVIHWRFGRIPDLAIKNNWEWKLITYIIRNSAYSIVVDKHSFKVLKKAGINNVVNIANPISKSLEKIALRQIGKERAVEKGKVVFIGHVYVKKGVYELIEACSLIQKVKKLKLIGPVKDLVSNELRNIAKVRENGEWLQLTGVKTREEVYEEISTAEFVVLPSYTEGFPNTIIEGMAMGCPILATNVGAIPEMMAINGDYPAGQCVPAKNVVALKTAIEKMLAMKDLQTKYGRNGLKRVLENYTMNNIANKYRDIWQQVSNTTI